MAPRGSLWLLIPPSGGPCWIPNATLVLLYGHSSATLRPLSRHSTATLVPFYCHSTTTLLCHASATVMQLYGESIATLPPLHCYSTATHCHSFATLLQFFCLYYHSTATLLPLSCHSTATHQQPGTTAAQIFPNPGPAGPRAAPNIHKFPSHTLLVQRQPNTLEAVWEKKNPISCNT